MERRLVLVGASGVFRSAPQAGLTAGAAIADPELVASAKVAGLAEEVLATWS